MDASSAEIFPLVQQNKPEEVKASLEENPELVKVRNCYGETPLHVAALLGRWQMAEILISFGADVNAKNINRRSPLHKVAGMGNKEVLTVLIEAGADVNARDRKGRTPLHYIVSQWNPYQHEDKVMAEILLSKGAKVNAQDEEGLTPLHEAAFRGRWEIAEMLISKGADVYAGSKNGSTPLRLALAHKCYVEQNKKKGLESGQPEVDFNEPIQNADKTIKVLLSHGAK